MASPVDGHAVTVLLVRRAGQPPSTDMRRKGRPAQAGDSWHYGSVAAVSGQILGASTAWADYRSRWTARLDHTVYDLADIARKSAALLDCRGKAQGENVERL